MRWEDLFDDLEGQAESLERAEREAEVADRTRSEVGQLTLMGRLRSNEGREISLRLTGGASLSGTLVRLGADWMLLTCPREVVVPLAAVATVASGTTTSRGQVSNIQSAPSRTRVPRARRPGEAERDLAALVGSQATHQGELTDLGARAVSHLGLTFRALEDSALALRVGEEVLPAHTASHARSTANS